MAVFNGRWQSRVLWQQCATLGVMMALGGSAVADIQFVTEMKMPGQPGDKPFSKSITFRKHLAERVETTTQLGPIEQRSVNLTLCDKLEMHTLDPDLKIYYTTPLVKSEEKTEATAETAPAEKAAPPERTTGNISMTLVSLREIGQEKIGDHNAKCYEIVTRMQSSGCAGDFDITNKQEICFAEGETLGDGGCGASTTAAVSSEGGENPCKTTFTRKGDWTRYDQLMQSLQVRTKMFGPDGKATMENQSRIVSRAKLSDDLFTIPEGFRKVTAEEFQKAQSQAMMQRMMTQIGNPIPDIEVE